MPAKRAFTAQEWDRLGPASQVALIRGMREGDRFDIAPRPVEATCGAVDPDGELRAIHLGEERDYTASL